MGSFTATATGFPAATFSETGALPSGVTFTAAGLLSGTPAVSTGGSYSITITASNGVGSGAAQNFTLTVGQPPVITSAASKTFAVGTGGTFTAAATGFPPPTFSETGALPGGVTFTAGGVLSGIPAANTGGTYNIVITASNGFGPNATQNFTVTVRQAPTITSATTAMLVVGDPGSFTVTAAAYPAATFSEAGTLPRGVTFTTAGVLSGTPAANATGTYNLTFTARNGVGSATQSFTLTIDQAPAITSAPRTTFTVGSAGSFTVRAAGFPAPTFSEVGTLPNGVTLTPGGSLTGTPAANTGGTYTITITASNGIGPNAVQNFTLTVKQAPAITSAAATAFTHGVAGSFQVTASGFPAPVFSETGALPAGVTFTAAGLLSGTPAANSAGVYTLTITARNGVGSNATQHFTLTVR